MDKTTLETNSGRIEHGEMLELRRWNTPTIYNGWEQITSRDRTRDGINLEETHDFMPQMGAMVGRAVTVVVEPSNPEHQRRNPNAWSEYRQYIASIPGPKIVVVQDLDRPRTIGSFWGEVNSSLHRALDCVGTIVDGAIRDVDEMAYAGFKALARRLCVGHAYSCPVRWNVDVEVFGQRVAPGQLVHADKHGFLVIPAEDDCRLLAAARFMDGNECQTLISAARSSAGLPIEEILHRFDQESQNFRRAAKEVLHREGEF
jgi:regulator of RNase E activity RraA